MNGRIGDDVPIFVCLGCAVWAHKCLLAVERWTLVGRCGLSALYSDLIFANLEGPIHVRLGFR
jgi:hypothetical protein